MGSNQRSGKSFEEAGRIGWEKSKDALLRQYQGRIDAYEKKPNRCLECGAELSYKERKKTFCNHTCSAKYSNARRVVERVIKTKVVKCARCGQETETNIRSNNAVCDGCRKRPVFKLKKICSCGREFKGLPLQEFCTVCIPKPLCKFCGKPVKTGKVFCSSKCQFENQYLAFVERWLSGLEDGNRGKHREQVSAFVRRWLIERSECKCAICGGSEWLGEKMPLLIDHIDGDSHNTVPENLRMICGNCDMQTSTYKGKNKGNGRFYRRERYRNEFSY
jgi:hypothetical protein